MAIELDTRYIEFDTNGRTHIIDITDMVQDEILESGFTEGQVTLFAIGSTTGLGTVEYEPGLVNTDIAEMYNKIAPYGVPYAHNDTWGDDNGASHIRSTLQGSSLVVPFVNTHLVLGTWQQIIFLDFDTQSRHRKVVIQLIGKQISTS